jgi:uncharacterized OB-fold protein
MSEKLRPLHMIAADLVEFSAAVPRVVTGRLDGGGPLHFPLRQSRESHVQTTALSPRGILWSWTVQRFEPQSPPYRRSKAGTFEPYLVGYVEFPEGLIVEGRIDALVDRDVLRIGQTMETVVMPLPFENAGETVHIFAFRPVVSP